jgi:DNA-binding IclR family transcriptional regulator
VGEANRQKYRIESPAKGLRVLALFSERRPAMRMTELTKAAGMPMPSLFRIVATLEDEGYLEQLPDGRYRPATKVLTLGYAALQLTHLEPGELDATLRADSFAPGAGPNAIRTRTALDGQLAQIRQRGYAVKDQEVADGLRSIAAPVRDHSGRVVAAVNIAVQAAEYDIERMLTDLKQALLDTCADASLRLGNREQVHS